MMRWVCEILVYKNNGDMLYHLVVVVPKKKKYYIYIRNVIEINMFRICK